MCSRSCGFLSRSLTLFVPPDPSEQHPVRVQDLLIYIWGTEHNQMHEETRDKNTTGLLILCLPTAGTSEIKTLPLACMQGPFNYSWKVHSICRIVLLLACSARSVLFQAQDEWHYLLYSYYRSLPLLAAGVRRDAIYHARREAGFLSNTFSPTGSSQCTSLMHF